MICRLDSCNDQWPKRRLADRVGIIFQGRMVKEGPLDELLALEDQTEIVLRDASPELLARVRELVAADGTAAWLGDGRPKTTLERLFLEETVNRK